MVCNNIDKELKNVLTKIFCVVGRNSPYKINDFVEVFLDCAKSEDFINNTCNRIGKMTGETVFSRLKDCDLEKITNAFFEFLKQVFCFIKRLLRNRKIALAFDITYESYYGKIEGLWIHGYQPDKGATGCFQYLTVSMVDKDNKFIVGNLPVMVGANIVKLIKQLIEQARHFITPEIILFDRGFDNLELIQELQDLGVKYQILWKKQGWMKKILKGMKRGEIKEVTKISKYCRNKSSYKIKVRYVVIKKYKRWKNGKAYDWVFATNTRQKSQHFYVDKYRKRWGIETVFRVLDNCIIKTTSRNEIIRYFLNTISCIIYNLWKLASILGSKISLKNFIHFFMVEYFLQQKMNRKES